MRKPKIRELGEALKVLFVEGPYTTKFPAGPAPEFEHYRGKPEYHEEDCIGCGACAQVCPARTITIEDDLKARKRTLRLQYDICIFCGQCVRYCTTEKGITQSHEYDLATLDRSETVETAEKDLVVCEVCGGVVGAEDHLRWIAERLGPLAYANSTLVLSSLGQMGIIEPPGVTQGVPSPRSDVFRVLCPSCRADIFLREEWR